MSNTFRIHSIRLRRWLSLLLLVTLLVITGSLVLKDYVSDQHQLQANELRILRIINAQSSLPLRRALEKGDADDLRALLSAIGLDQDVLWTLLTDERHVILESSRYAWRGRDLQDVLPIARNLISPRSGNSLQFLKLKNRLLSLKGIDYLSSDTTARKRSAMLWIALDTRPGQRFLQHKTLANIALLSFTALALLGALLWILTHFVERPLQALGRAAHRIASGNLDTGLQIRGEGEIGNLAISMRRMEEQIRSNLEAARANEQRLSITLNSIGDAVLVTDPLGLVVRLNPKAEKLTGWSTKEAVGHPVIEVFQIVNAETREPAEHPVGRVLREGVVVGLANHTTLIARDGREYQIADSAAPIRDGEGEIFGVIMVFQDVTERYALESRLQEITERLQAILTSLPDPCFLLDEEGRYLDVLGGPEELLARDREFLLGKRVSDVLPSEQAETIMRTIRETVLTGIPQRVDYAIDTLSGHRHFEGSTALVTSSTPPRVVWLARDLTERYQAEEQLHKLARYDQLTGLANRSLTGQRLDQILHANRRTGCYGAIMFIDVDRFKNINDSLGHHLGDQLLYQVGDILRRGIRAEDIAARFGGDEFVILLGDLGSDRMAASAHAELIAEKLREACMAPVVLEDQELHITVSIGIVLFPEDGSGCAELLKRADIAMYKAKEAGRNRICFFSPELQEIAESRLTIQRELRTALEKGQLRLFVHPRVDQSGHWIGGEVLVRWLHPERGLLAPGSFIPIAESTGLIDDIDEWVISHAIARLGGIQDDLPAHFTGLSMNITTELLLSPRFPGELQHWSMEHAVPPERLELEITERVLLEDHVRAAEIIEGLRGLGIHFSIDDFGTGYSSLRYLQRLPLNTLKIDKSFVDRLPTHPGDARIVTTIIDMAGHLGLEVVAEGVETREQMSFLEGLGCRQFQGYLFARPMPWEEFFKTLPHNQPLS